MRIKGAMTILNKEAKFLGMTVEDLVDHIDNSNHYTPRPWCRPVPVKVLQAYQVYKMDQADFGGGFFAIWAKA